MADRGPRRAAQSHDQHGFAGHPRHQIHADDDGGYRRDAVEDVCNQGVPAGADLLRTDALQQRLRRRDGATGATLHPNFSDPMLVVSPSASCVGTVRDTRSAPAQPCQATPRSQREVDALAAPGPTSSRNSWWTGWG